jgi:2-phospho-L-lactate/phosphoenolpyruvate guanylyltransferase
MTIDSAVLLVPQKDLDIAKGRLALAPTRRRQLAVAMLRRALVAATAARFGAVMVVLDNPDDEQVFSDLDVMAFHSGLRGLNASLVAAEEEVRTRWGSIPLAVMPADLPFATPDLLDRSLCLAAPYDRAFIPDRSARGTTLLFVGGALRLHHLLR